MGRIIRQRLDVLVLYDAELGANPDPTADPLREPGEVA